MVWVSAARLRTLPLSVAGIFVGNALAIRNNSFCPYVFAGTLLTAIIFQVLSNFANDYGDGLKGTDNQNRIGPKRILQQKLITSKKLYKGIVITGICGFIVAASTTITAFGLKEYKNILMFLAFAIIAVISAYKYTAGKGAYGYYGLGDLFVFIFFGVLAVCGSYYMQTKQLDPFVYLFAIAMGGLSTAVLNLNNMRDIQNDNVMLKKTVAVLLGLRTAKAYHSILIIGSITAFSFGISYLGNGLAKYLPVLLAIPLLVQLRTTLLIKKNKVELQIPLKKMVHLKL